MKSPSLTIKDVQAFDSFVALQHRLGHANLMVLQDLTAFCEAKRSHDSPVTGKSRTNILNKRDA
jgi:hypothetical protein